MRRTFRESLSKAWMPAGTFSKEEMMGEIRRTSGIACATALLCGAAVQAGQLTFKSESGDLSGEFGGRVIVHGRFFTDANVKEDTFYWKELFIDTKGKINKVFEYKVEGNFGGTTASLADGWMAWKMNDMFRMQFGQFKLPFLFEETSSASTSNFPERPLIDRLAPGRDLGIQFNGDIIEGGAVSYAAGMSNGSGINTTDTNDSKEFFGQARCLPFKLMDMDDMGDLQLAVSGTHGSQRNDTPSAMTDITDPSTGTTVVDFQGTTVAFGARDRVGYEALWAGGPASITYEYVRMDQNIQRNYAGGDPGTLKQDRVRFNAWYFGGTYFLTGEDKKLGSLPKVKDPVSAGGWGALEVAARYGFFNPDQKLLHNFPTDSYTVSPTTAAKVTEIFLGVNYYPVNAVRFTLSWVMNDFSNDLDEGLEGRTQGHESAIITRMQIMF